MPPPGHAPIVARAPQAAVASPVSYSRPRAPSVPRVGRHLPVAGLHLGLVLAGVAAFAPWSTIAGRPRDGFGTANVLLTLARDGLPSSAGWLAAIWYTAAFVLLAGWGLVSAVPHRWAARAGAAAFAVAAVLVIGFTWAAGEHARVATNRTGPVLTLVGITLMAVGASALAASRSRVHPSGSPG